MNCSESARCESQSAAELSRVIALPLPKKWLDHGCQAGRIGKDCTCRACKPDLPQHQWHHPPTPPRPAPVMEVRGVRLSVTVERPPDVGPSTWRRRGKID
jgi:hypothetical protein